MSSRSAGKQLDQAAEMMRSLMENSSDYILISDKKGKPLYFNNSYRQIMKETLGIDMVPGLIPHKLLPDPETIAWWDDLHARVLGGETFTVEYPHQFTSGEIRHFELSYTPIRNNGEILGFTEITRDISERKKAEEEVIRKESMLKTITDSALDSIFCKDIERRYTFVNPAMTQLLGCTEQDLIGKTPEDVFGADGAKIIKEVDDQTFRGQKVSKIRPLTMNGETRYFHTVQVPMETRDGVVISINGIVRDVTDNILFEKENTLLIAQLRESEERYRSIFENSPLGIVYIDTHGIIKNCNAKFVEILNSAAERLIGLNTLESLSNKNMVKTIADVLSGKAVSAAYEGKYRSVTGTGRPYVRGLFSRIQSDEGEIAGAIGIFEDITERKQIEEELQQAHDTLEIRVAERTAELVHKTERLGETNVALKILLDKRKEDQIELEKKILTSLEQLVSPYLEKLQYHCVEDTQKILLNVIRNNLAEITSTFAENHKDIFSMLTPKQIQIADLIKQGHTTREIASILKISVSTVACHRQEIRKRLSLNKQKINLQSVLTTKTK